MDDKARIAKHHSQLCGWLCDAAYPVWSTRGVDPAGGFHERLGMDGEPLAEPRRSRVNPRQAYCFAMAHSLGWRGDSARLVKHGLEYWVAKYRRPDGLYRTLVNADGSVRDDRALLYDQAFGLLAGSPNMSRNSAGTSSAALRWASRRRRTMPSARESRSTIRRCSSSSGSEISSAATSFGYR